MQFLGHYRNIAFRNKSSDILKCYMWIKISSQYLNIFLQGWDLLKRNEKRK